MMDFYNYIYKPLCFIKEIREFGFHFCMSSIAIKLSRSLTIEAEQIRNEVLMFVYIILCGSNSRMHCLAVNNS